MMKEIEAYLGIWLRLELEAKAEFAEARTAWVCVDPEAGLGTQREVLATLSTAKAKLARAEGGVSALKMILEKLKHEEKSHNTNRRETIGASYQNGLGYIAGDEDRN